MEQHWQTRNYGIPMLAINTDSIAQQYLTSAFALWISVPDLKLNELSLYLHVLLLTSRNVILFLENTLSRYTEQN